MNALAPVTAKLDPLIRRLASGSEGEIIACVIALRRQLVKAGLDFNDLADHLTAPAVIYQPEPESHNGGVTSYRQALDWIAAHDAGFLSMKEARFVADMRRNLSRWRNPTSKQADWIDGLLEKTGGYWL